MKLPFLLNSAAKASSVREIESVFLKFLKILPDLDGSQVSNVFNLLSKKDVKQPLECWSRAADALVSPFHLNEGEYGSRVSHADRGNISEQRHCQANDDKNISHMTEGRIGGIPYRNNHEETGEAKENHYSILSGYDVRDGIIILNAFSKVEVVTPNLVRTVVNKVMESTDKLESRELSSIVHALGKRGMMKDVSKLIRSNPEVVEGCTKGELDYSMILRVMMLNRDRLKGYEGFEKIVSMLDKKCVHMSDKSMAILVNSLARFGRDDLDMVYLLTPLITRRLRNGAFTAMCISQIANGIARLNRVDRELMSEIAKRTCSNLSEFDTRCKVTILNAFHKLNHFNEELFALLVPDLTVNNEDMTPQCIANTISAVAHFSKRITHEDIMALFNALSDRVLRFPSLQQFTIQNQVNILNGLSKVGIYRDDIYEHLADNMIDATNNMKSIDVACIVNAFARASKDHELLHYICKNIGKYLESMKPQELTCVLNSMNKLRKDVGKDESGQDKWVFAIDQVTKHMIRNPEVLGKFRPLDVRLSIMCLSDCCTVGNPLYDKLLQQLEANIPRASMWDLVCIFSALNKVNYVVDVTFLDVLAKSLKHIGTCKDRGSRDAEALRMLIEQMGHMHSISEALTKYSQRDTTHISV